MGVISRCVRVAFLVSCFTIVLVAGRRSSSSSSEFRLPGRLQKDLDRLQQDWSELDQQPTAHISEAEIITPHHLAESGEAEEHTVIKQRSITRTPSKPFKQQPWPYTRSEPPCNTYARQDNCVGNPPISPNPLPACGPISTVTPNTTVFAIVGDYGLDGNCESQVHGLVMKLQQQFGTLSFIMTTGDNAYWVGDQRITLRLQE
jgi:hypothetical protein